MIKVLFVCTGNTCRSPMAEGFFRAMLRADGNENIMCQSAGIAALPGQDAAENAIKAMAEENIDISSHESRRLTSEEIMTWDVYFVMSETHGYILEKAGVPRDRIYVSETIDDPFGGDIEVYRKCRDDIKRVVADFYGKLKAYAHD